MGLLSTYYVPGSGPSEILWATLCPHSSPDQGALRDPAWVQGSSEPEWRQEATGARGGATQRLEVSD